MSIFDANNSQIGGDVTAGDMAGGDIAKNNRSNQAGGDQHIGANADAVLQFLRDYVFLSDQQRETALKEIREEVRRTRLDIGIQSDATRGLRDRLDRLEDARTRETEERKFRQKQLDRNFMALGALIVAVLILLGLLLFSSPGELVGGAAGLSRALYDLALASPRRYA